MDLRIKENLLLSFNDCTATARASRRGGLISNFSWVDCLP